MFIHHPACASRGSLGAGGESPGWCHCSGECRLRALEVLMGLKCIFQIFSEPITPPAPQRGSTPACARSTHMGQWRWHPRVAKGPWCQARAEVCRPPPREQGGPDNSQNHPSPITLSPFGSPPHGPARGGKSIRVFLQSELVRSRQGTWMRQGSDSQHMAPTALVCLSLEILSPASRNV